jgi:hypothetical protein
LNRLPNFIIAGGMRCGTTSLNGYLREHPDVAVSTPKEVHFFDVNFGEGLDWYRERFPGSDGAHAVGEATPDYVYHPEAVRRISETLPDVKLIVLLRNPVDRAYSHYWHNRSRGKEPLEFEAALEAEPERIAAGGDSRAVYSYADRGRYREQLERTFRHVPAERVLVRTFEALERDPADVFAAVCRFLDIDDGFVPANLGQAINAYVEFRSVRLRRIGKRLPGPLQTLVGKLNQRRTSPYPAMSPTTRERLAGELRTANRGLDALIGQELPVWS